MNNNDSTSMLTPMVYVSFDSPFAAFEGPLGFDMVVSTTPTVTIMTDVI